MTLTDYFNKITVPQASDSYKKNIMHEIGLYLK